MKPLVIIPTYNEAGNIQPLIRDIFKTVPQISICIVDDNSPDDTAGAVLALKATYPNLFLLKRPQKEGLGNAYIAGFRHALSDDSITHIIMMDGDFSHDPVYLPQMLSQGLLHGLVIGSRYAPQGGVAKWELWRRLLSTCANQYIRMILGYSIHDWTSGFNCIDVNFLSRVDLKALDLSGYAFLQELKYELLQTGVSTIEIPIIFQARRGGESKISAFIIREGVFGPWKIKKRINARKHERK